MTKKVGALVDRVDPKTYRNIPESSLKYDQFVLKARENPGNSVLVAEDFPEPQTKVLRNRRRAPWYLPEGHVIVSLINSTIHADGIRRGQLLFTWEGK